MASTDKNRQESSEDHTFKGTATAAVALNRFAAVKTSPTRSHTRQKRRKGSNQSQTYLSLHEQRTVDIKSLFQFAAEGKLTELCSTIENFGFTLKERDANEASLLHSAAKNNQTEVMKYLIESGIDLNTVDADGNTALHLTVEHESIDALQLLLESGANDTILNKKGHAPLHIAAVGKNNSVLAAFLEYDVDMVVAGWCSRTPLHVIAENDNQEGCETFHAKAESKPKSFRLCAHDEDGLTPTHLAARMNSYHVLDFFISNCRSHGYSIETILGFLDEENSTPLHAAVDRGNTEVVKVLLKHGASPVTNSCSAIPPLHLACSQGRVEIVQIMVEFVGKEIIHKTDENGKTPLHYCAYSIHSSCIVSFIAQQGLQQEEINKQDNSGHTPLHKAISVGNVAVVKELLANGANALVQDHNGENALHIAVRGNRRAVISELLHLQCIANLCTEKNNNGFTAVHFALRMNYGDLISSMLFVIKFQHQDVKDKYGNSYLHLAALSGNWKAMTTLLDSPKKNLNETNEKGSTPLHFAALKGNYHCVQLLLNSGAMVHKCACGLTPLMLACKEGHTDCVQLLYEAHPFQINWKDDAGNTALHFAAMSKNPSMVKLILDFNCSVTHNKKDCSFFDLIIATRDNHCALAIINHKRWQECLDFTAPSCPHPMIGLVQAMPDVARAVLDRSHEKAPLLSQSNSTFCDKFDFKYVQCVCEPRKQSPESGNNSEVDSPSLPLFAVRYKGSTVRRNVTSKSSSDFHSVPSMEVLQTMMKQKRVDLLIHPVVSAYLKMKWRNYGRYLYAISFLCLVLMVTLLSVFVTIVPNPLQQMTPSDSFQSPMENASVNHNMTDLGVDTPSLSIAAQSLRIVVLILNTLFAIQFITISYSLGIKCLNFVRYVQKWIYAFGVIFNYVFLLAPNPLDVWPVGAVACFLSWLMLILSMEFFDVFGTYVKMFTTILRTVFQVFIICIFLLMGFAYSFYILAGGIPEFSTISYSLFSMIGYMLGEIPYSVFIRSDRAGLQNGDFVMIFVVLVTILLTIVMANLLIGLAVGDIERVKLNAVLEQRTAEIEFYTTIDKALPVRVLCRFSQPFYVRYPLSRVSPVRQVWQEFWHSVKDDLLGNFEQTHLMADSEVHVTDSHCDRKELEDIKKQLLELTEIIHQLRDSESSNQTSSSRADTQTGQLVSQSSFDYRDLINYEESNQDGGVDF